MEFRNRIDRAKRKMRDAEDALEGYVLSGAQKYEEYCQLAEAVISAMEQFIDQFVRLCPKDETTLGASSPSTSDRG